jgi:starch synthase
MRVLFASAEFTPVARVGGLAEAAAGLVHALRAADIDVDLVLPDYGDVELDNQSESTADVPWWVGEARFRTGTHPVAGAVTLVDVPGMARSHPYVDADGKGWPDNDHRFMSFAAAIAAKSRRDRPDVVHLNDWHTAAALGMMIDRPPAVLTIHTLGYQGVTASEWLTHIPVEPERFAWYDGTNPLAGGIDLADRVIAVSPTYAQEIVTPEGGMGLHERLGARGDRLVGIRNGIDTTIWNPSVDQHIVATFESGDDPGRLACRTALHDRAGWSEEKVPLIAVVSRLVEQKGIDLLADAARFLPTMPARLMVLGAGDAATATALHELAAREPESVWFFEGYDEPLAHELFAGSDLFAMPSRFEPCGLAQMQAMAYGSIPVVTDVGGLRDTVIDADVHRSGNGFVSPVDPAGIVDGLHRAVRSTKHAARRRAIQRRGMSEDWSWTAPAAAHIEIYRELVR